jgi:hypothetical protein
MFHAIILSTPAKKLMGDQRQFSSKSCLNQRGTNRSLLTSRKFNPTDASLPEGMDVMLQGVNGNGNTCTGFNVDIHG